MRTLRVLEPLLAAICTLGLFASEAFGLHPNRKISQYGHVAWRMRDGVFTGQPTSITQTGDGYIWIGTTRGLFRFDGERFQLFRLSSGEQLTSEIRSLLTAKDGSLWLTSGALVEHLQGGSMAEFRRNGGDRRANRVVQALDGTIWATYSRLPLGPALCRLDGVSLKCLGTADGVSATAADAAAVAVDGTLWYAGRGRLGQWNSGHVQVWSPTALQPESNLSAVQDLAASADGSMWVGMADKGVGLGLQHVVQGRWSSIKAPGFNSDQLSVSIIKEDRAGSLWIGTDGDGLYRLRGEEVDHYGVSNGLTGDSVTAIAEDGEGDLWVGTSEGLDKFRDLPVSTFSLQEGLKSATVDSVLAAADGSIWIGTRHFLEHLHDGSFSFVGRENGLPGEHVTSLMQDRSNRIWIGVGKRLYVYAAGKFTAVDKPDGDPIGLPFSIAQDSSGTVWAINAYDRVLYRVTAEQVLDAVPVPGARLPIGLQADKHGGLWIDLESGDLAYYNSGHWSFSPPSGNGRSGQFMQMAVTDEDSVVGASSLGLIGWRQGTFRRLGPANGLPCKGAASVVLDKQGTLWAYTDCGVISIEGSELQRWWEHPDARLVVKLLDSSDGAMPGSATFEPRSAVASDGTVWFANGTALQQIKPSELRRDPIPPPVYVEAVIADRRQFALRNNLELPALSRDLEIDYSALSFAVPERVRFRYRLEGWDKDWQDASTRRQAFYTNLEPGSYRFHVIACNGDGVWNEIGATLDFSIAPRFYQTIWFQVLCGLAMVLLAWSLYLLRLRQATARIQEGLGARLEERERISRELHDTLLQGVQGLMLRFQGILNTLPADQPAHKLISDALDRADELMLQARRGVKDIRSAGMTENDFPDMLKSCAEELQRDHTVALKVTFAGNPRRLDVTVCTEAYRIAREALTNAFRHSAADNIEVEVTYQPGFLRVSVRDDGHGIEPKLLSSGKEGHWGLSGMRERAERIAARLRILSHNGAGTEVELTVPGKLAYAKVEKPSLWSRIKERLWRGE